MLSRVWGSASPRTTTSWASGSQRVPILLSRLLNQQVQVRQHLGQAVLREPTAGTLLLQKHARGCSGVAPLKPASLQHLVRDDRHHDPHLAFNVQFHLERRVRVVECELTRAPRACCRVAQPRLKHQQAAGVQKTVNPRGRQSDLEKLVNHIPPASPRAKGPGRTDREVKRPQERHLQVRRATSRGEIRFNSARPAASFQKSSPSEGERSFDLA